MKIGLKHTYMVEMTAMRNSWGENHLNYIGMGPTTLEGVGRDYENLRARLTAADSRMKHTGTNFTEIMSKSPMRKQETQDLMALDEQASLLPSQKKPFGNPEGFRQAQSMNYRVHGEKLDLLKKDFPRKEHRRELNSQQRAQDLLAKTLSNVKNAEQRRYRQILRD